jgi:hypothetical protein
MSPIHPRRGADHSAGKLNLNNAGSGRRRRQRRFATRGDGRNKPDLLLGRQCQCPLTSQPTQA